MGFLVIILLCLAVISMLFKKNDEKDYDDYVQWWELNISSFSDYRLREEASDLEKLIKMGKAKPGAVEVLDMINKELQRRSQ